MNGNGNTTQPPAPALPATGEPQASTDAPPKWFVEYTEKVDGRLSQLGKDLGRVRDKTGTTTEPTTETPAPTTATVAGVSRDDLHAARKLGAVTAKLPEAAQAEIEEMISSGKSYSEALASAELIAKYVPGAAIAPASTATVPTGVARGSAPRQAPPLPKTKQEYFALRQSDPARHAELATDPSFDLMRLPNR